MREPDRIVKGKKVWTFSNSQLSSFLACPRKYWLQFIEHVYVRRTSEALSMGSGMHSGIEAGYNGKDVKKAVGKVYRPVIKTAPDVATKQQALIDRCKAYAMANGYLKCYLRKDKRRFKKILVEPEFEFKLSEGKNYVLTYDGHLDVLMLDDEGWWVMEHKSAADVSDAYRSRLSFNAQVMGYAWGAKKITGVWPKGVIYNMVRKTGIRRKIAESLDAFLERVTYEYEALAEQKQYFIRDEFRYNARVVKDWKRQAKVKAELIRPLLEQQSNMNLWFQNTDSCLDYRACPMLNACKTGRINDMLYVIDRDPEYLRARKERNERYNKNL